MVKLVSRCEILDTAGRKKADETMSHLKHFPPDCGQPSQSHHLGVRVRKANTFSPIATIRFVRVRVSILFVQFPLPLKLFINNLMVVLRHQVYRLFRHIPLSVARPENDSLFSLKWHAAATTLLYRSVCSDAKP